MTKAQDELKRESYIPSTPGVLNVFPRAAVVPLDTALRIVGELERENAELREKLVDLALSLAARETAEDRKRILESEDVRSIMDLRLR